MGQLARWGCVLVLRPGCFFVFWQVNLSPSCRLKIDFWLGSLGVHLFLSLPTDHCERNSVGNSA